MESDVLKFLFDRSYEDSNQYYDITTVAGKDSLVVANKFAKDGLIKSDIHKDGTSVKCAISIKGIMSIDPGHIDKKMKEVFSQTGEAGTIWNVVDLLKEKPEGFQFCFDLANEMQNRDLVKLLYALYPTKVMVEMTLEGAKK